MSKTTARGIAAGGRVCEGNGEPVFGQTREARGLRQFLVRGLDNIRQAWGVGYTGHYLTKLAAPVA